MNDKLKFLILSVSLVIFVGCKAFTPISNVYRHYPPTIGAIITTEIPTHCEYIGTLKLVPHEFSRFSARNKERLLNTLQNEAAKLGANYVCIKDVNTRPNDWFLNVFSRGSGYTLTADLYR
jgi:hypothetical protein